MGALQCHEGALAHEVSARSVNGGEGHPATAFTAELQKCVSHFSAKCNSTVIVEGAYDANEFSADGWWVPYGLCDVEETKR